MSAGISSEDISELWMFFYFIIKEKRKSRRKVHTDFFSFSNPNSASSEGWFVTEFLIPTSTREMIFKRFTYIKVVRKLNTTLPYTILSCSIN